MNNESVSQSQSSMHHGLLIFVHFWTNCNVEASKALFWAAGISALYVVGKSMRVARGALGAVYHMTSLTSATEREWEASCTRRRAMQAGHSSSPREPSLHEQPTRRGQSLPSGCVLSPVIWKVASGLQS